MNIKHTIIISLLIHGLLIVTPIYFLSNHTNKNTFRVKKGPVSFTVKVKNKTYKNDHNQKEKSHIKLLVSTVSNLFVTNTKITKINTDKRKTPSTIIGALSKRADINSKNNPPVYPYIARKLGWQGTVILEIEVSPGGTSGKIRIKKSSGYSLLDSAAKKAAQRWSYFNPGEITLKKSVIINQPIHFMIQ